MNLLPALTDFDKKVRALVYDQTMRTGAPPASGQAAAVLSVTRAEIQASLQKLAEAHMLVLQREAGEVLMANPFSAVPTPFLVRAGKQTYFGNCIWDAMGIPAMLKQDAVIQTSCADCGTAMMLEIEKGELKPSSGLIHFAVPAIRWWEDIVFT